MKALWCGEVDVGGGAGAWAVGCAEPRRETLKADTGVGYLVVGTLCWNWGAFGAGAGLKDDKRSLSHRWIISATCRSRFCSTGPVSCSAVANNSLLIRSSNSLRKRRDSSEGELLS